MASLKKLQLKRKLVVSSCENTLKTTKNNQYEQKTKYTIIYVGKDRIAHIGRLYYFF